MTLTSHLSQIHSQAFLQTIFVRSARFSINMRLIILGFFAYIYSWAESHPELIKINSNNISPRAIKTITKASHRVLLKTSSRILDSS